MFEVNCLLVQEAITAGVGGRSVGDRRRVLKEGDGAGQASRAVLLPDGQLQIDIIIIEASSGGEDGNALPFGPRCRSTTQSPSC